MDEEGSVDELWQARKYIVFPWMKRGGKKGEKTTKLKIWRLEKKKEKEKADIEFHRQKERKGWMKKALLDGWTMASKKLHNYSLGWKEGSKKEKKNNKI